MNLWDIVDFLQVVRSNYLSAVTDLQILLMKQLMNKPQLISITTYCRFYPENLSHFCTPVFGCLCTVYRVGTNLFYEIFWCFILTVLTQVLVCWYIIAHFIQIPLIVSLWRLRSSIVQSSISSHHLVVYLPSLVPDQFADGPIMYQPQGIAP